MIPGLKLNIRKTKPKQGAQDSTAGPKSKLPETKKTAAISKKSMFKSRQGGKAREASRPNVISTSFNTTDDTESSSVLTAEDGLFDMWGIDTSSSTNLDDLRTHFANDKSGSPRTTRPVIEFNSKCSTGSDIGLKDPQIRRPKNRNSWISSSFNADGDADSEDELDDSIYTLLDDEEENCHFRKLSLHDILIEEELSFRKSLVWNDEERSTTSK